MADVNISSGSIDLFILGSLFNPAQTVSNDVSNVPRAFDETELSVQSNRLSALIQYSQSYGYCGTALDSNLGTIASAFGGVRNATSLGYGYIVVGSLQIKYSAMGYPAITLQGHNHAANAHTSATPTKNITSAIPSSGFGVPAFGITVGSLASQVSAQLTITKGHKDVNDADGTHIHGANTGNTKLQLNMEFVGIPTSNTESAIESDLSAITGFDIKVLSVADFKNNTGFTSFAFSAEGYGTT